MKVFVDASVIVAIIANEDDHMELRQRLKRYKQRHISGMVLYESIIALQRIGGSSFDETQELVHGLLKIYAFVREPVAINQRVAERAVKAFETYGKGRHSARLNMGDCFSYACAKEIKARLLFTGNDFNQTDIAVA